MIEFSPDVCARSPSYEISSPQYKQNEYSPCAAERSGSSFDDFSEDASAKESSAERWAAVLPMKKKAPICAPKKPVIKKQFVNPFVQKEKMMLDRRYIFDHGSGVINTTIGAPSYLYGNMSPDGKYYDGGRNRDISTDEDRRKREESLADPDPDRPYKNLTYRTPMRKDFLLI